MRKKVWFGIGAALCLLPFYGSPAAGALQLSDKDTFETQGLSVIVHQNSFHPVFRDEKIGGI